jgi:hypothetical protein
LAFLFPLKDERAILLRKARGILNKLCPQKFDVLVKKFNELQIDTEDKLKDCMELVFEKVLGWDHWQRVSRSEIHLSEDNLHFFVVDVDSMTLLSVTTTDFNQLFLLCIFVDWKQGCQMVSFQTKKPNFGGP